MPNLKRFGLFQSLAVAAALAAMTGCQSTHDERSEGRVVDDNEIKENVKKDLENEPVYKFTDVDVATFGGIVQLSGFVNNEDQKRRAAEVARRVPGVRDVVNGIALKPQPQMAPTGVTNSAQPKIYSQ